MTDFDIDDNNTDMYRLANAHRLEDLPKDRLVELLRKSWADAVELRRETEDLADKVDDLEGRLSYWQDSITTVVRTLRDAADDLEDLISDEE